MRIDKYLQVSRIIKRRSVAKEIVDKGRVEINGRIAKAGTKVAINDLITIRFGNSIITLKVLLINDKIKKDQANTMYELISNENTKSYEDNAS